MTPTTSNTLPRPILIIGPDADQVGGMSSVVSQMMAMDFGGHYRPVRLPVTLSEDPSESTLKRIARHRKQSRRIGDAIRADRPPVVHIHTCSGFSFARSTWDMLIARRLGARTVLHIHGAAFHEFYERQPMWRRRLIRWSLTQADRVIALSDCWAEQLLRMAPAASFAVIENAVEIPSQIERQQDIRPCRFVLLARMDEWKGIDDLLEASALLRRMGCTFEVVLAGPSGTAGDHVTLPSKIDAKGLTGTVRYVGSVQGYDKIELLRSAHAYVQPSHNEGMPIALLEALAHALPVVATRVGAVPEVIRDEREGLTVAPHRPDRLADAMHRFIDMPDLRVRMARSARQLAEARFSTTRFERDLTALYRELAWLPPDTNARWHQPVATAGFSTPHH